MIYFILLFVRLVASRDVKGIRSTCISLTHLNLS
jgi:hypothetical protein